ncbi:hypothetical protein BDZ89DRAFT_1137075 [Hymenopellis radicata]|nr:hypothetical protein BDZ89DRAFT_1137075 [Hymenopellis radicata]
MMVHALSYGDLPIDIVRLIFETVAFMHPPAAVNLVLVSKMVRRWIEPILYRTVELRTFVALQSFSRCISSRNDHTFFARHVKSLCLGDMVTGQFLDEPIGILDWDYSCAVLTACVGVHRVAFWLVSCNDKLQTFWDETEHPQLTHMSLLDIADQTLTMPPFQVLPCTLTHLHLDASFDIQLRLLQWDVIFSRCPQLTHAFVSGECLSVIFHQPSNTFPQVLNRIIDLLPSTLLLFIIGVCPYQGMQPAAVSATLSQLHAERRVVVISPENHFLNKVDGLFCFEDKHDLTSDWSSEGHVDVWEFAENCVAQRNAASA